MWSPKTNSSSHIGDSVRNFRTLRLLRHYQSSELILIHILFKGWEDVLFEVRSESVKTGSGMKLFSNTEQFSTVVITFVLRGLLFISSSAPQIVYPLDASEPEDFSTAGA